MNFLDSIILILNDTPHNAQSSQNNYFSYYLRHRLKLGREEEREHKMGQLPPFYKQTSNAPFVFRKLIRKIFSERHLDLLELFSFIT